MKRSLVVLGLLLGLATTGATAQTRVGVSITVGHPQVSGHIVIGRPHYRVYSRPHYIRYRPARVVVVAPRVYRQRVVVVRPHRYHPRRHHRRW